MANTTTVVGIDPGLVNTGLVEMQFDSQHRSVVVRAAAFNGIPAEKIKDAAGAADHIYIEAYRPRSNFGTDQKMVEGVAALRKAFHPCTVLNNTGVKNVVGRKLMELLGVWRFTLTTNHQDLRSAARIALYGMLKAEELNTLLATIVHDQLHESPWSITTKEKL